MKVVSNIRNIMMEKECKEISFGETERILIVSPHQDDETLGCGALINKYTEIIDILLITNGELGNPEFSKTETVAIRNREFEKATKGVRNTYKLDLKDSNFTFKDIKQKRFDFTKYDAIFIPGKREKHPDHQKVNRYIKRLSSKSRIYEYEVWSPLWDYNCYLNFSNEAEKKWDRIKKYECQIKHINYLEKIKGLNCYRGIQLGADYVECYYKNLYPYERLLVQIMKMKKLINKWKSKIYKLI